MKQHMRKAPTGQFRVIGVDNARDSGWRKGDYSTLSEAKRKANPRDYSTIRYRVYDDRGECVHGNEFRHVI